MKVLATDLDGTLLYPNRRRRVMPKKNAEFLAKWISCGNKVVCISSRSLSFLPKLEDEVGQKLDYIGASSAQIKIGDKIIKDECINPKDLAFIVEKIEELYNPFAMIAVTKNYPFCISSGKNSRPLAFFYRNYWKMQGKKAERYILDNKTFKDEIANGKVYKIMIFYGLGKKNAKKASETTANIRNKYPNIEANWSKIVVELTPKGCHKASGLSEYCEKLNIPTSDVYVVGDSGNDISMFKEFNEHSYCLKHAYPSVKKYAKHIIRRVYNLDKLVLEGEK